MKLCVFALLVCIAVTNAGLSSPEHQEEWNSYKIKHHKSYKNPAEDKFRMKVFLDNKKLVVEHNKLFESGASTFKMAVNKYSDLTHNEFVSRNKLNRKAKHRNAKNVRFFDVKDAPDTSDWRNNNVVTGVKNQGQCGSCWSFSTTGSLEGQIAIHTGNLISFSEQNLVDCSGNGNNGCDGGNVNVAFDYITSNGGIDTEDSYPYTAADGSCQYDASNSGGASTGYTEVPQGDEDQLKQAIGTIGPISVAIDASQPSFQQYDSGVYYDGNCSSDDLDHAVLAVGYDSDNGNDYYIVKNSWGDDWGEGGYIRMSRNNNNNCGIASDAGYPSV